MRLCSSVLAASVLLLVGCREREIQAYRVPKEKLPEPPPTTAHSPHAASAAAVALTWTAPSHWQEKPAGGFRRGSFTIPGSEGAGDADFSIIAFPGAAGGMADNFNRWREQLALPEQPEAEILAAVQHLDGRGGLHFDVVDYVGTVGDAPTRILGAVAQVGGESWFFKMMGPDAVVAAERDAFLEFLHTVRPSSP